MPFPFRLLLSGLLLAFAADVEAAPRFKAVAFDYFVIFNPNSVIPEVEKAYPGKGAAFTKAWRAKQFEYGFLRSITGRHADFFKVTEDALVYTAEAMKLPLSADVRQRLLGAYLTLQPGPTASRRCASSRPRASASSPSPTFPTACCARTPSAPASWISSTSC